MKTLKAIIAYFSHSVFARTLLWKQDNHDNSDSQLPAIQKIGKTWFSTHWLAANSVKECLPRIWELVQAKEIKFKVCKHDAKQYIVWFTVHAIYNTAKEYSISLFKPPFSEIPEVSPCLAPIHSDRQASYSPPMGTWSVTCHCIRCYPRTSCRVVVTTL